MTPERRAAMLKGKEIRRRERHKQAITKVREFRRWLAAGSPRGRMPSVPSSSDYRNAGLS